VTLLEGILARGDRRLSPVILKAYRKGSLFDSWTEWFKPEYWNEAFKECGIDPDFYSVRERDTDEILPWDFINIGVSKEFMIREWKNAKEGKITPNCRMRCSGCGARNYGGGVCYEG
jgi:hypothetical protein